MINVMLKMCYTYSVNYANTVVIFRHFTLIDKLQHE